MKFTMYGKIKLMFQTTNQELFFWSDWAIPSFWDYDDKDDIHSRQTRQAGLCFGMIQVRLGTGFTKGQKGHWRLQFLLRFRGLKVASNAKHKNETSQVIEYHWIRTCPNQMWRNPDYTSLMTHSIWSCKEWAMDTSKKVTTRSTCHCVSWQ